MTSTAKLSERTSEIEAFLDALTGVAPTASTYCDGWTAHDLLAHVVAGGEELHRLVAAALAGDDAQGTRAFDEREAPLVALPDRELRERMTAGGLGLLASLDQLHDRDPLATVAFTGADLTPMQVMTHVRSELALHRWDLIGDDDVGRQLLGQHDLLVHGRWVLEHMPTLAESARRPANDENDLLLLWGRRP
jgi:uncharacterized protein (TIGR03083 family)